MSENAHVLSGLIRKRSEIAGRIEATQAALRQLIVDLDHVDSAIRLFDPTVDLGAIKPRRPPPPYKSLRGDLTRIVLSTLREAAGPLTTKELAAAVMAELGLNSTDPVALRVFARRIAASLRYHRDRGVLRQTKGQDECVLWEIADGWT